jgi:hypothetical protein
MYERYKYYRCVTCHAVWMEETIITAHEWRTLPRVWVDSVPEHTEVRDCRCKDCAAKTREAM